MCLQERFCFAYDLTFKSHSDLENKKKVTKTYSALNFGEHAPQWPWKVGQVQPKIYMEDGFLR